MLGAANLMHGVPETAQLVFPISWLFFVITSVLEIVPETSVACPWLTEKTRIAATHPNLTNFIDFAPDPIPGNRLKSEYTLTSLRLYGIRMSIITLCERYRFTGGQNQRKTE